MKDAIIDGEIVSIDKNGRTNFSNLQAALSDVLNSKDTERLVYYAFDLLWLNGEDLRLQPLLERKEKLDALLKKVDSDRFRSSEHWTQDGAEVLSASCQMNLEGIISKRVDSTYESGRSGAWMKSKCSQGQEFIIGGFTTPKGSRSGFGSLLVGAYDDDNLLRYVGRVGTGFDEKRLEKLSNRLVKMATADSPFQANSPRERDITFVRPELVCQIRFAEWTNDKIIRHAVFDGLREDKDASLVKIEKKGEPRAVKKKASASKLKKADTKYALTHPDKILYPEVGVTKRQMAEYYDRIQDLILPHLVKRPLSLVRCPDGAGKECFFQKKLGFQKGKNLKAQNLKGKKHQEEILTIDSAEGLYELVQMGVLEIHCWGTRVPSITKCDLIVFDLDPDEGVSWTKVKEAALEIKALLEKLNLKTFLKVTGGKGLHIHVPIEPEHTFDEVKAFSLSVVQYLEKKFPERYTSNSTFAKRKGRIFLDYLRNGYGATSVAPYSLRAKDTATIACPIAWSELGRLKGADLFTLKTIERRLRGRKDPWLGYFRTRQRLDLGGQTS